MNELFTVPRNKTKLEKVMEAHGIETLNCNLPAGEKTWFAICRPKVVEALSGYGVTAETHLVEIFAGYSRLLDEGGLVGFGETEAEAVLEVCALQEIGVVL